MKILLKFILIYYYIWQIEKVVEDGNFKDYWMKTGVSNPEFLGDTI